LADLKNAELVQIEVFGFNDQIINIVVITFLNLFLLFLFLNQRIKIVVFVTWFIIFLWLYICWLLLLVYFLIY